MLYSRRPDLRRQAPELDDKPTQNAGPETAQAPEAARQPIAATTNGEKPSTTIVTAYSLRVRLESSRVVQIGLLTWPFMAQPSKVVQGGPRPLLAEALAVSVRAPLPEPTHVALVLPSSRTLSPVDQQIPRLTGGLVQLDFERIGIPLDEARESHPILLDRRTTPNLVPPRLAAGLRLIHDDHRTPVARGQADPERRAGHGPSTGSRAAAIAPNPAPTLTTGRRSLGLNW